MHASPPAIVLGADCLTGLQTARILWRRGVPVVGVAADPGSPYCRSRALARRTSTRVLDDPGAFLAGVSESFGARPVLLACTDEFAGWLSGHREAIAGAADFLLPDRETLDRLSDKALFARSARERGLPVPETRLAAKPEELRAAADALSFPVVVKPRRRDASWHAASGGEKVVRIESPEALLRRGAFLLEAAGELIVQSWVEGPESRGLELTLCMDARGEMLAGVVLQKLRQWRPRTGTATLAVQVDDEEVLALGLALLRDQGYAGVGQIEFKRDVRDGRLYLIEMNAGRTATNAPLCEAAGVDLTHTWYCAAAGRPLPGSRQVTRPGARWICWKRDLAAAVFAWRRGELGFGEWLRSVRGPRWSADVQLDDPLPLFADLLRKGRRSLLRAAASRGSAGPSGA